MELNLMLDNFEGPFDLLLQLIRKNKMEITDVRISEITEQYMAVLRAMEELDLEIATEFLVLAASLIEIKSRELLPKHPSEEAEIPSKELLLTKLQEYEFFRQRSEELSLRHAASQILVTRLPMTLPEEKTVEIVLPENFGPKEFFLLYVELLDRQADKVNRVTVIDRTIPAEEYKVEDKVRQLESRLRDSRRLNFSQLAQECASRAEAIVFFLAILEMARHLSIRIHQAENRSELIIERRQSEWPTSTKKVK